MEKPNQQGLAADGGGRPAVKIWRYWVNCSYKMSVKPGVGTILRGMRISILSGMLWGKQCADGRSAMKLAIRFWWSASAAGSNGGIFSPGRMKSYRFVPISIT